MNVLNTMLAVLVVAAASPVRAGPLIDGGPATIVTMPAGIGASAIALQRQGVESPRAIEERGAGDATVPLNMPIAGMSAGTAVSAGPGRPVDAGRTTPAPDPGTLQVFGLGLVILATVAGTQRRKPT